MTSSILDRFHSQGQQLLQVLKYSEILSQLESARQDAAKVCRELEASRAETQAAKLATDAVTAEKARAEEKLGQHVEEDRTLNEVIAQHALL